MEKISFRKFLLWIKNQNKNNAKQFFGIVSAVFVISTFFAYFVDYSTPFFGLWMFVRAFILIPLSITMFLLLYSLALFLHKKMRERNPAWPTFRERFSPSWRNRISIIVGAFLLLVIYTSQEQVGYTFVSSLIMAIVIALFAFMRKTKEEKVRADLGIPDERDVEYSRLVKELEKDQEQQRRIKTQKKSQKKYEKWGIKDENYVEEIEEETETIELSTTKDEFDFDVEIEETED